MATKHPPNSSVTILRHLLREAAAYGSVEGEGSLTQTWFTENHLIAADNSPSKVASTIIHRYTHSIVGAKTRHGYMSITADMRQSGYPNVCQPLFSFPSSQLFATTPVL